MPRLTAPLFSANATGRITPGLAIQRRYSQAHLGLRPNPITTYTRPQLALRTYLAALAGVWKNNPNALNQSWLAHAHAKSSSPYHAYVSENFIRRGLNLYPLTLYKETPAGSAPTITGKSLTAGPQRLTGKINSYSGYKPQFVLLYWTPPTFPAIKPNLAQAWFAEWDDGNHVHHATHVAPGTYTVYIQAIDIYGRPSNASSTAGLVVTA